MVTIYDVVLKLFHKGYNIYIGPFQFDLLYLDSPGCTNIAILKRLMHFKK